MARFWVGGAGTWDSTTTTHWSASSGGAGGSSVPASGDNVTFDASSGGGTVTVDSTVNGATIATLTAGAFTGTLDFSVNNPSITFGNSAGVIAMELGGSGTRTINLGSGTFTFNVDSFDCATTTGLTANFSSAKFVFNATSGSSTQSFNGGGLSYGTLTINSRSGAPIAITGSNTFGTLNINGPSWNTLAFGTTQTVGALNISGTSPNFATISSSAVNSAATINVTTPSVIGAILRAITFGTSAVAATNTIDGGLNNMNGGSISPPSSGGGGSGIIGG